MYGVLLKVYALDVLFPQSVEPTLIPALAPTGFTIVSNDNTTIPTPPFTNNSREPARYHRVCGTLRCSQVVGGTAMTIVVWRAGERQDRRVDDERKPEETV